MFPSISTTIPQEVLQDQQVGLAQASIKLLPLPWVLAHAILCVLFKSLRFPQSWGASAVKPYWPSKPDALEGSSSQCWMELSFLWENLCDVIILQFVGHSLEGYGI